MTDAQQHLLVLGICLKQPKILRLCILVTGVMQRRRFWIPFPHLLEPVIGLYGEEVGIENMAQLVGK